MRVEEEKGYVLLEEYLSGRITLEEFERGTACMPLGAAMSTRFMAVMRLLERIEKGKNP
ncbi:hypothetical protein J8F10_24190 [Gemmata sp. G18]|uniref:Uncharacterized protein n=1 Tax=Gemmata palustris TaxID=2822762 RepID=A0ABS5BXC6_9BACT|nr:hypothetical protein [Gemmata palustris]MBP3958361.1 hypothetical protein [Gemmata palustris]